MVGRTSDGAMLTTKSAALRFALPQPFFAEGASLSEKPVTVAFRRVAPSVPLSAFAILATGLLAGHGFEDANIVL